MPQAEDVVRSRLDDLPEAGVGAVGEGQQDGRGGTVLVDAGEAAQPGAAGQRRAGEEDGKGALLLQDVGDGSDTATGDDLDGRVHPVRRFPDRLRQFGGALEDEDLRLHHSP